MIASRYLKTSPTLMEPEDSQGQMCCQGNFFFWIKKIPDYKSRQFKITNGIWCQLLSPESLLPSHVSWRHITWHGHMTWSHDPCPNYRMMVGCHENVAAFRVAGHGGLQLPWQLSDITASLVNIRSTNRVLRYKQPVKMSVTGMDGAGVDTKKTIFFSHPSLRYMCP